MAKCIFDVIGSDPLEIILGEFDGSPQHDDHPREFVTRIKLALCCKAMRVMICERTYVVTVRAGVIATPGRQHALLLNNFDLICVHLNDNQAAGINMVVQAIQAVVDATGAPAFAAGKSGRLIAVRLRAWFCPSGPYLQAGVNPNPPQITIPGSLLISFALMHYYRRRRLMDGSPIEHATRA